MNFKGKLVILLFVFGGIFLYAQSEVVDVSGEVVSMEQPLLGVDIINISTEEATKTDDFGKFTIKASIGNKIAFFSKKYKYEVFFLTKNIIEKDHWRIELKERTVALEEITLTHKKKKFLEERNAEFKKYYYGDEHLHGNITNIAATNPNDLEYSLDFANIYRALRKSFKKDKTDKQKIKQLTPSVIIRGIYPDAFFKKTLKIPKEQIGAFLYFCEQDFPDRDIFKKQNEFQLLDFLVKKSTHYRKKINEFKK